MELLPPAKRGRPWEVMSAGADITLPRQRVAELRKVYGGLPAEQLAELKAKAVETGESLSRAAGSPSQSQRPQARERVAARLCYSDTDVSHFFPEATLGHPFLWRTGGGGKCPGFGLGLR